MCFLDILPNCCGDGRTAGSRLVFGGLQWQMSASQCWRLQVLRQVRHVAYLVEDVKVHSPDPLPEDEKVDVWS